MTSVALATDARPWTRNPDGSYTCNTHGTTFRLPRSCPHGPCGHVEEAVTPLLPAPPQGCIDTVALELDANEVRDEAKMVRAELRALAHGLAEEMRQLRATTVKAKEYYRDLETLADLQLRVVGELRKQGELQIKANRRAGDYAARREDDYLVDKRNEYMPGGGSN